VALVATAFNVFAVATEPPECNVVSLSSTTDDRLGPNVRPDSIFGAWESHVVADVRVSSTLNKLARQDDRPSRRVRDDPSV
jgi:hypothetical protein